MKIIIEHEQINATTTSLVVAQRLLETIKELEKTTIPLGNSDIIIPAEKSIVKFDPRPFFTPQQREKYDALPDKKTKKEPDIFDTKDISDIPEQIIKPKLPPFKPAWLEKHIDFNKSRIIRYSNPCSTLHGKCGGKCYQTELWTDTNGDLDTCDCEFYELDELKSVLNAYIKDSAPKAKKANKHECHCSKERLQRVADLVNQGCTNKQIAERLGISPTSAATYKGDCKRLGMLN